MEKLFVFSADLKKDSESLKKPAESFQRAFYEETLVSSLIFASRGVLSVVSNEGAASREVVVIFEPSNIISFGKSVVVLVDEFDT